MKDERCDISSGLHAGPYWVSDDEDKHVCDAHRKSCDRMVIQNRLAYINWKPAPEDLSEALSELYTKTRPFIHEEPKMNEPPSNKDRALLPISALSDTGILWLINRTVFHPRGFALSLMRNKDGTVSSWNIKGTGKDVFVFNAEDDALHFAQVIEFLASLTELPEVEPDTEPLPEEDDPDILTQQEFDLVLEGTLVDVWFRNEPGWKTYRLGRGTQQIPYALDVADPTDVCWKPIHVWDKVKLTKHLKNPWLSREEVLALPEGTKIEATWDGSDGPQLFMVAVCGGYRFAISRNNRYTHFNMLHLLNQNPKVRVVVQEASSREVTNTVSNSQKKCFNCGADTRGEWWNCCPTHTPENSNLVVCRTCSTKLHPEFSVNPT